MIRNIIKFDNLFIKIFLSVMAALLVFAGLTVFSVSFLQDTSNDTRHKIVATQVLYQIEPVLHNLRHSQQKGQLLEVRYLLATLNRGFKIYDEALNVQLGLYDTKSKQALLITDDLPNTLPPKPSIFTQLFADPNQSNTIQIKSNSSGFTLLYKLPKSNKAKSSKFNNIFVATAWLLLVMVIVTFFITRNITWRINQLSRQIIQFGKGDFTARVTPVGNDEITILAKGFNHTAESIERLIEANKLLLAHVSHEIRTPITRIRLNMEMMDSCKQYLEPEAYQKFLKRSQAINRDLNAVNSLVEDLLLLSRLDSGRAIDEVDEITEINLLELIESEICHYPQSCFYATDLVIEGQKKLLIYLIRNLLENAYKYGVPPVEVYLYAINSQEQRISDLNPVELYHDVLDEPESVIQSTTFATTYANHMQTTESEHPSNSTNAKSKLTQVFFSRKKATTDNVSEVLDYQAIQIAVIDQGHGIPVDKREDIFNPFIRLQSEKKGTGLGLSLVSQIVKAHHGKVITDTYENKTRFLITLPIKQCGKTSFDLGNK